MKRILALVLAICMILCIFSACDKKSKKRDSFDTLAVGVGRADITPEDWQGAHINGGGDPNRLAEGILDEQVVTCVAVTDENNQTMLFFHQDVHNPVAEKYTNDARQLIADATGVAFENIYMAATHTHSALGVGDTTNEKNEAFNKRYFEAIVEAAQQAMDDRAPATMFAGAMNAQEENGGQAMAFVRHYKLTDGSIAGSNFGNYSNGQIIGFPYEADNEAQLIKFEREGKDPVLMMNWPAHSTFHGTTALRNISADYPYYLRTYIEENTDMTVAIFLGGAGDQTPHAGLFPAANHGLECADYGYKLGELVTNFINTDGNMTQVEDGAFNHKSVTITVATNKIPAEQQDLADKAEDVYKYFLENGQAEGNTYALQNGFQSCYEARSFYNRLDLPDSLDITIDVLSLGNMSFAVAPYEMSGESARYIKNAIAESSEFDMAFIIAYCQNNLGYIPSVSNFEYNNGRGSYEAYDCSYAKGTCEQLAETYVNSILELK